MWKVVCTFLLFFTLDSRGEEPAGGVIEVAEVKREKAVDFEKEVLPIFKKNCLACHNAKDAKGELVLETPAAILKGGENGPAVVPGKGGESLMVKLAARREKPVMPPRNNKAGAVALTSEELGLIKVWIDQGATGIVSTAMGPVNWQPLPASLKGISAVAITRDGQFVACGRANQIFIYHLPTKRLVTRLTDPALLQSGYAKGPGIADRDIIQSLAFNPEGNLLASGAYRSLKLWERKAAAPELSIAHAAAGDALAVAASSDGTIVATGGEDGTVKTWGVKEGKLLREFRGHSAAVNSVAFSPDDARLVSGSADKTIRVWDVNEGTKLAQLESPAVVDCVVWTGKEQIASGGGENAVRLWTLAMSHQENNSVMTLVADTNRPALNGHGQPVTALAIVPGKRELLSASKDGVIKHWDLSSGNGIREMNHGGEVTGLAVRGDAKRLASAGLNNAAKLWNLESGQAVVELKGDRQAREFATAMERALTFSKCEVEYQKAAVDGAEKAEKAETEALKKAAEAREKAEKAFAEKQEALRKAGEGKAGAERSLEDIKGAIAAAKEKKGSLEQAQQDSTAALKPLTEKAIQARAAAEKAASDKSLAYEAIVDAAFQAKLAHLAALEAKVNSEKEAANAGLAEKRKEAERISAEKRAVAQAAADNYTGLKVALDSATALKAEAERLLAEAEAKSKVSMEVFAANEKVITDGDKNIKEAEEKIKNALKQFSEAESGLKQAEGVKMGAIQAHESTQAALKKAGEVLAKARDELKKAEETQAQANQVFETARKTASETEKAVHAVAFTRDNQMVLWAGEDGVARSASAETGQAGERFVAHSEPVHGLAVLTGSRFVSVSADQSVKVWDSESGWELKRVIGDGSESSPLVDRVMALDFSADGKLLASSGGFPSRSGEIKIWNASDGSLFKEFTDPHSDTVVALDFSPDQKYLASGGADKFLRVFAVESGKQVKAFEGHTHHVQGVSWKHDQRTLASAGADKVVKIWDFVSGEQRKTVEGFGKEMTAVQFLLPTKVDRNFEALVSSGDAQVKLVREDGNHTRSYGGSAEFVSSAVATPDGAIVVAGASDGVLRVWNGENGQPIVSFEPPSEEGQLANK